MGTDFGVSSIGGYGYDPYLMALLQQTGNQITQQQCNPAFRAAAQSSVGTGVTIPDTTSIAVPTVQTVQQQGDDSNVGAWVGGALATAVAVGSCIYAHKRGAGDIIKGFKNIWKDIKGSSKEIIEKVKGTTETKLDKLMVIKDKQGNVKFLVPGKTKTYKGSDIERIAGEQGIDLKKLYGLKSEANTTVHSGTFEFKNNADTFTVSFKDGKIEKILKGNNNVTSEYVVEDLSKLDTDHTTLLGKLNDFVEEVSKNPKISKNGLFQANITRQVGDNIINVDYVLGSKPSIKSLTTLEALNRDSDAVKNYLYEHKEIADIINSKDFLEGKILMGKTPEFIKMKYDDRYFVYKNGELQGFYENVGGKDVFRKKGSEKYGSYMIDHSEKLSEQYTQVFKNDIVPSDVEVRFTI